jgi:hypothetical protein
MRTRKIGAFRNAFAKAGFPSQTTKSLEEFTNVWKIQGLDGRCADTVRHGDVQPRAKPDQR